MSEIRVTTFETTANASTNSLLISQNTITINSTVLAVTSDVTINTSIISIGNSTVNTQLSSTTNTSALFLSGGNVFPNSNDVYAWASAAVYNNCTIDRDYTIEKSPYGGIPMKIAPTGADPYPSTYGSNTWNLAPAANGETWKISGWIRANATVNISSGSYLLALPANANGAFISGSFPTSRFPSLSLTENTWTYFEAVGTLTSANISYMQIRPDGLSSGLYDTWYDGIEVRKEIDVLYTELVNTQIFTANGTWTKPSWATDGNELVIVHMWGGGGSGSLTSGISASGGGGGAFVFGYYMANQLSSTVSVTVGSGGLYTANATSGSNGGNSVFSATNATLTAYGGGGAFANTTVTSGGGGGGWLSNGNGNVPGNPLPGGIPAGAESTFGGGFGSNSTTIANGGVSVYGGGGGNRFSGGNGGSSIFGGGGGGNTGGSSIYGGRGGNINEDGFIPGGGGGYRLTNGARGEVRVYTLRKLA